MRPAVPAGDLVAQVAEARGAEFLEQGPGRNNWRHTFTLALTTPEARPIVKAATAEGLTRRVPQMVWARGAFVDTGRARTVYGERRLADGRSWHVESVGRGYFRLTLTDPKPVAS